MSNAAWVVILGIVSSVFTLAGAVGMFARYIWRQMLEQIATVNRIEKQVTPNGGNTSHLGDQVINLRKDVQRIELRVMKLEERPHNQRAGD